MSAFVEPADGLGTALGAVTIFLVFGAVTWVEPRGVEPLPLRRAKAARHLAGPFRGLQSSYKQGHFYSMAFPYISEDLLGLLHK